MEVFNGQTYLTFEMEDLDYSCISGDGSFNPLYILKFVELVGYFSAKAARLNIKNPNQGFFIAWQQIEFSPHLQTIAKYFKPVHSSKCLEGLKRKVKAYNRLYPIGNTSQTYDFVVYDETSSKIMFNCVGRVVNVDFETKQPAPFPQDAKDYFSQNQDGDFIKIHRKFGDKCTRFYKIPENVATFCQTSQITANQVDYNNHVNNGSYVAMSLDCLAHGFSSGFWKKIANFSHDIERISCLFLRECVLGDVVDTIGWQNASDPTIFHFHVKKKKYILCQLEFQLFSVQSKL